MLQNLLHGLTALGNGQSLAYLFGGSLAGMFFGVIPGIGGAVLLSIVLAFIFHISVSGMLSLFLAVHAASYFSASIASILLNTPQHPEAFAVTFDGFPMAQRDEAGRALGISAASTCLGGLIGCAALVGFIQIINYLPKIFEAPEYIGLIAIALLLVSTLGTDAVSKALASAGLGLVVASIGGSPVTGVQRFIFNNIDLEGGISLVSLVLGLFAIPQMTLLFGTATRIARQDMTGRPVTAVDPVQLGKGFRKQVIGGVLETVKHWPIVVRGGLIGVLTGLVPGIGGFAANFISYGVAQQTSKHKELFGTGIPEGIIAPEASSISKEAGGLVPLVALGIPGGVGSALFLVALSIKGIKVGYGFATTYPTVAYEMVWVIALGGLIGTVAGLLCAPLLARVTRVPGLCLVPFIMTTVVVGSFVSVVAFYAVIETLVFASLGLLLRRLRYSIAAFAIGLVLGPTLETNIYLTHQVFPGVSFLTRRPLADGLFALAIFILVLKAHQVHRDQRMARHANSIEIEGRRPIPPYPLLDLLMSIGVSVFGIFITVYGIEHYNFTTAIMPAVAGGIAGAAGLWRIPFTAIGYASYRVDKARAKVKADEAMPAKTSEKLELVTAGGGGPLRIVSEGITDAMLSGAPFKMPRGRPALPPIIDKHWGWNGQYTRELVALGWFVTLITLIYYFGFDVGAPVFGASYSLIATRRVFSRLLGRLVFAICAGAVLWVAAFGVIGLLHIVYTPRLAWPMWLSIVVLACGTGIICLLQVVSSTRVPGQLRTKKLR